MFATRVKSISTSFTIALLLGAGPVACSGAPQVMSGGDTELNIKNLNGDYTISAGDSPLVANLAGLKLINGEGPHTGHKTEIDVALEVQGVGVQFEKDQTYAYVRADRTFTDERRVGIRFRFQF